MVTNKLKAVKSFGKDLKPLPVHIGTISWFYTGRAPETEKKKGYRVALHSIFKLEIYSE